MQKRVATSRSVVFETPVAQPGTVVCAVRATPITGARPTVAGCMIELMRGRPFSCGVMSCVVSGKVTGSSPLTQPRMSRIASGIGSSQPSRATGVMATPRWFTSRLPRVVSTERMAAMAGCTSLRIISRAGSGARIIGTGWFGRVAARGQICVWIRTGPGSRSPCAAMSASFSAAAIAAMAPSASETSPTICGRAPMPPRRPMMPSAGRAASAPGRQHDTKSVAAVSPCTCSTTTSATPRERSSAATCAPSTWAPESSSKASTTCFIAMDAPVRSFHAPPGSARRPAPAVRHRRGTTTMHAGRAGPARRRPP